MKKTDILANKLKEAEIREKDALIKFKQSEIDEKIAKSKQDQDKIIIEKLDCLRSILCSLTFDENSPFGSEQKLKPMFDDSERQTIKDKIFDIIPKL